MSPEDDIVADSVIAKMVEYENKVYNSITELKEAKSHICKHMCDL